MTDTNPIDDRAMDSLSVAPPDPAGDAGTDRRIEKRVERDPDDEDAVLDRALDESMDASDPPSNTRPGGDEPHPSSGYHEESERQQDA
ncbi:hypothetical protein [Sphingomonas japonica]|uniref:Uncharacterized protein n=1 Tax=Sphingomonas japonica TaxID=511662 RepID=A0ABX0TZY2_9SPHN|nr:hypothetical protein [Sphingomonas japonica]NIJ22717.1 hypothetical protein [Sphingomonas japonica]